MLDGVFEEVVFRVLDGVPAGVLETRVGLETLNALTPTVGLETG